MEPIWNGWACGATIGNAFMGHGQWHLHSSAPTSAVGAAIAAGVVEWAGPKLILSEAFRCMETGDGRCAPT
jgi:hypothetical protein